MAVYGMDASWGTFTTRAGQRLYIVDDDGNIRICFAVDGTGDMYLYSQFAPISNTDPWFGSAVQISPGSELEIGGT